jgi:hypothetical protein
VPTRQQHQKPPPGFCFAQDSTDDNGNVVPGIATRLGITYSTYRKWRMAGKGPATIRIGKCVAARITAVAAYLDGLEGDASQSAENYETRPPEPRVARRAAA